MRRDESPRKRTLDVRVTDGRLVLLAFLIFVVFGGFAMGYLAPPGPWYEALPKPAFNPPNWVFGPVWTVLYVLIALAGWRVWRENAGGWPMRIWWVQLGLNYLWTPIFFGARRPDLAFGIILLLLGTILAFIALSWKRHRVSAWLFVPYAFWVAFASLLNGAILILNSRG